MKATKLSRTVEAINDGRHQQRITEIYESDGKGQEFTPEAATKILGERLIQTVFPQAWHICVKEALLELAKQIQEQHKEPCMLSFCVNHIDRGCQIKFFTEFTKGDTPEEIEAISSLVKKSMAVEREQEAKRNPQ